MTGTAEQIRALARDPDYIVLSDVSLTENLNRAPWALAALAVALVPPMVGWLPVAASSLTAALLMVVTRCVSTEGLRRCFDWNVLALIIGTIPLGLAMEQHGVAGAVAQGVEFGAALGPWGILACLFLLAAVISNAASNAAAAVVLSPVALPVALSSNVPAASALLAVAYGASCNFVLPFSSQALILVMTPAVTARATSSASASSRARSCSSSPSHCSPGSPDPSPVRKPRARTSTESDSTFNRFSRGQSEPRNLLTMESDSVLRG